MAKKCVLLNFVVYFCLMKSYDILTKALWIELILGFPCRKPEKIILILHSPTMSIIYSSFNSKNIIYDRILLLRVVLSTKYPLLFLGVKTPLQIAMVCLSVSQSVSPVLWKVWNLQYQALDVIRCHKVASDDNRWHQMTSDDVRRHQNILDVIRSHQMESDNRRRYQIATDDKRCH